MQINDPADRTPHLLRIGFRIFFLGAIAFALVSMGQWTLSLALELPSRLTRISATQWHAHEMIFGYACAVIAGFLLTAVQNWTGHKTIDKHGLAALFTLWLCARLLAAIPHDSTLWLVLTLDVCFLAYLSLALIRPLVASHNHKQWGIIGKLALLLACDVGFHLSTWGLLSPEWQSLSLLIAVYVVIGLIIMMARRVLPFFTQNGIPGAGPRHNHRWVDISSLLSFLIFVIADVFHMETLATASGGLFIAVSLIRLWGWHHPGIWSRPLLWVLYTGYLFILIGVAARALPMPGGVTPSLGLHLMTYGGIGLFTAGMMARVSLGHTGRDVSAPPYGVIPVFALLIIGALLRSVMPAFFMGQYGLWLLLSQLCWLGAFGLLLALFSAILIGPRVDGRYA